MAAASRNRLIVPGDDNYGFAGWVERNKEELRKLGEGRHFGEWWGKGIQRGYGLEEKRFSLFNTNRWHPLNRDLPSCCSVVPVLYTGAFTTENIDYTLRFLRENGSVAAPGFMNTEGIVVFHTQSRSMFKVTHDDSHKES